MGWTCYPTFISMLCFNDHLLSYRHFTFGHCIVRPSNYGFKLPLLPSSNFSLPPPLTCIVLQIFSLKLTELCRKYKTVCSYKFSLTSTVQNNVDFYTSTFCLLPMSLILMFCLFWPVTGIYNIIPSGKLEICINIVRLHCY